MRLSTSTCIYFNRPDGTKASVLDSVKLCSEAGYRVMDMNFHDCSVFDTPFKHNAWKDWVWRIKEQAECLGIEFSQGHSHFYNFCDTNTPDKDLLDEYIRRGIEAAGILGIRWLVIHAATDFDSPWRVRDSRQKTMEYLKPCLELAEKHQVGIAIENLWDLNIAPQKRYTATAEELAELVDALAIDFGNVGICWDIEHSEIMKQDLRESLKLVGSRLKATHISDFIDPREDHILPYRGVIDWTNVMQVLKEAEYDGDFTFEIHRHTMRYPDFLVLMALKESVAVGNYLLGL